MLRLGEILIRKGIITSEQLETALAEGKKTGEFVGKLLVDMKFITEEQFLEAVAEQLDLKFLLSLKDEKISDETVKAVPAKLIWHYKFMPLDLKNKVLTIAVSDPMAVWAAEDLKLQLGFDIERVVAPQREIEGTIRKYYGLGAETVEEILKGKREEPRKGDVAVIPSADVEDLEKGAESASVIRLVNQILSEAISSRTTDIHIEPYRESVRIRYRIDGVLYDISVPDEIKYLKQAMVSRIKILSNLDVVEKRLPQDGRAIVKVKNKQVDLRISIIPSLYGENVVIRILPVHLMLKLEDLGIGGKDLEAIVDIIGKPHGIIFLTGPTGSGKTTTLYACLTRLNKESVKIITIEDPIEYELGGVTQIQVKPEIGLSFASVLRSVLRHDPDVMMVGEVRDLETAELAIRTSLTGHLIFSTLHTNDAPSGVTRLIDIGIEPYLVASSVNAFISQRLVRMVCPNCKEERKDTNGLPDTLKDSKVYRSKGCKECGFVGYKGRVAIYEILVINDQLRQLIIKRTSAVDIRNKAKELGLKTLFEAGMEKVKMGITTPEEVMRVIEI